MIGDLYFWIVCAAMAVIVIAWLIVYIRRHFVRPFLCYKLVIMDTDDEQTFIKRKKDLVIEDKVKGYYLFEGRSENPQGEFYQIPLEQEDGKHRSKKDDLGFTTYYFYRNKPEALLLSPSMEKVSVIHNASTTAALLKSKIYKSALLEDEKTFRIKWWMVLIFVLLVVIGIFWDKIAVWLHLKPAPTEG